MLRTHTCGELRLSDLKKSVTLCGWVHKVRNVGTLFWVDLRDRYGRTQLICTRGDTDADVWALTQTLGREDVLRIKGQVIEREKPNSALSTGEIEIQITDIVRLSRSQTPPFLLDEPTDGGDLLRLQHRYLDLRRAPLQRNLEMRHSLYQSLRSFLNEAHFLEIETPMLIRSTPEGARDFLVPSRLHEGASYALPQSPQLFKQLLMVAGMDRYYQIARCFRDEDHRSDRQPEFTQLDCELSFVTQEDILSLFEALICHVFRTIKKYTLPQPFPRLSYEEAMQKYGTDKPDLRYDMPLFTLKEHLNDPNFPLFSQNEAVWGLVVPGGAQHASRKQLDAWQSVVRSPQIGAAGLTSLRVEENDQYLGPLSKNLPKNTLKSWIMEAGGAKSGDLMLFVAGKEASARVGAAFLRTEIGSSPHFGANLEQFCPLWVLDFPLFTQNAEENALKSTHHPFTAPKEGDENRLEHDPLGARAQAYDLVINGVELGGGSLRITSSELQKTVFDHLGMTKKQVEEQFGFLLKAFQYGVPPHGGMAIGLDRLCAMLTGEAHGIRDCIAFPKNAAARDVMIGAPATTT